MGKNRWEQEAERFRQDCERARDLSLENLRKLMRDNQDTEYGRAHHFAEVETAEDYRRLVPVTDYSDYEGYVERMRAGEQNLLTVYPPRHFVTTSGSAGKQKWIPLSDEALSRALVPLWYACHGRTPGIGKGRHLMMSVFRTETGGPEPETLLSVALYRALYERWTNDLERSILGGEKLLFSREIGDVPYTKLWIALSSPDMAGIQSIFLYDALLFFRYFEENWESVLKDMESRRIPDEIAIGERERRALLALPVPPEEWSEKVRRECKAGFTGIVKRLWESFQWISGIGDSAFAAQEAVLRDYLGDVPIHYFSYTASECFIAVAMEPEMREYVLIPRAGYFEFLPLEEGETRARTIGELTVGEEYEIVVTNFSGLYRYRLGDVVRVTGFCGESPVLTVCYRKNQALNVAGEKIDMRTVARAVEQFSERTGLRVLEYSVCDDRTLLPGRYLCFLEVSDEPRKAAGIERSADRGRTVDDEVSASKRILAGYSELLDEILRDLSDDYRDLRELGMIGDPQVLLVEQGAHQSCRKRFQKRLAHSKPLQYLSDPEAIAYMKKRIL
ncbi:MAG: GH3 auxin-responsive promoter family protein [Lachnospiraceae bacterium]|nr:GH3 auxin-responsive promoter family protein [Lachnospiraceae bacterium]